MQKLKQEKPGFQSMLCLRNELCGCCGKNMRRKPEPLKGNLSGWWSRRIDGEHRIVYREKDGDIIIASCRGHYEEM